MLARSVQVMPESGTKFWAYDFAKSIFCSDPRHPHVLERLLCGACAGAASCLVIYPLEVTKTRLAVAAPGLYEGVLHCMCETVRVEGLIALYKGLGASLAGIIPFSAVDLALYNVHCAAHPAPRTPPPRALASEVTARVTSGVRRRSRRSCAGIDAQSPTRPRCSLAAPRPRAWHSWPHTRSPSPRRDCRLAACPATIQATTGSSAA